MEEEDDGETIMCVRSSDQLKHDYAPNIYAKRCVRMYYSSDMTLSQALQINWNTTTHLTFTRSDASVCIIPQI
jgi:hypothetical protein